MPMLKYAISGDIHKIFYTAATVPDVCSQSFHFLMKQSFSCLDQFYKPCLCNKNRIKTLHILNFPHTFCSYSTMPSRAGCVDRTFTSTTFFLHRILDKKRMQICPQKTSSTFLILYQYSFLDKPYRRIFVPVTLIAPQTAIHCITDCLFFIYLICRASHAK